MLSIFLNDQFFILLLLFAICLIGIVLAIYIYYMRYKIRLYDTCIRELYDLYGICRNDDSDEANECPAKECPEEKEM